MRRETMYGTSERGNDDPSKNLCEEMVAASVDDGDRSGAPPELPKADTDAEVMGSKNGACADCLNVEALGSSVRADVEETKVRGGESRECMTGMTKMNSLFSTIGVCLCMPGSFTRIER